MSSSSESSDSTSSAQAAASANKPAREPRKATDLARWSLTLNNALSHPEISAILSEKAYPPERLNQGIALIASAQERQAGQSVALGTQKQATKSYQQGFRAARSSYADFREAARGLYVSDAANPQPWAALNLTGEAPMRIDDFLAKATATYRNALGDPEIRAKLSEQGYDDAGINAAQADITALDKANQAQEAAMGSSMRATQSRDEAFAAAKAWMFTFQKVARRALKGRDDLKKVVGW